MALLDALDRFSLEQKRAVTLPLLRTMLASPDAEERRAAPNSATSSASSAASSKIGPHG
jgi:DnaA family protein